MIAIGIQFKEQKLTYRRLIAALLAVTTLSGCEVPVMIAAEQNQGKMTGMFEITFPAVMIVQFEEGTEEVLKGDLIGHANGSAKYDLSGPTWGHCTGGFSKPGISSLKCDNGASVSVDIGPQRPKMSGTNVVAGEALGNEFISAFGWGNDANEAAVRQAIAEYQVAVQ